LGEAEMKGKMLPKTTVVEWVLCIEQLNKKYDRMVSGVKASGAEVEEGKEVTETKLKLK
jgi:hypothetical protein